ncbi:MAG TPA: hypothetical protein VN622_05765 [Clostridia bacterium]|nr:hypothetical protein [Clostridia bacterium]
MIPWVRLVGFMRGFDPQARPGGRRGADLVSPGNRVTREPRHQLCVVVSRGIPRTVDTGHVKSNGVTDDPLQWHVRGFQVAENRVPGGIR